MDLQQTVGQTKARGTVSLVVGAPWEIRGEVVKGDFRRHGLCLGIGFLSFPF